MKTLYRSLGLATVVLLCFSTARAAVMPCTATQLTTAKSEMASAKLALAKVAREIRSENPEAIKQLSRWLGVNNSADARKVAERLDKIGAFADGASFRCENATNVELGSVYAFVDPSGIFVIMLGHYFFKAPAIGLASRMGVLIHEMSHFVLAGATIDPKVYGPDEALKLAKTSPGDAQKNAENLEYFVESVASGL